MNITLLEKDSTNAPNLGRLLSLSVVTDIQDLYMTIMKDQYSISCSIMKLCGQSPTYFIAIGRIHS